MSKILIIVAILFCTNEAFAAFLPVQQARNQSASSSGISVTVSATTQGNLVVVGIDMDDQVATLTSVTDNASGGSNTYALSSAVDFSGKRMYVAYGVQVNGGATSITTAYSGATAFTRVGVDEYSGGATTNATVFDKSSTGSGGGTSLGVTSFTPTQDGNLIVAWGMINNFLTWTAGTNYTLYNGPNPEQLKSEYRLSSSGAETAPMSTATDSFGWGEIAMSFNPAPASTTTQNVYIYNTKLYNTKIYG